MGSHSRVRVIMMYRACLVLVAMSLCSSEASYGYGGSGKAYIIPGTEPRVMPGVYKQKYMQPVYITSYVPVHHEQHASPVQYVAVAPTSGYHHAPAPAVHASALSGHGYSGVSHGHTVAPVVSHDTAAHVSHGHTVAPVVGHDTAAHVSHGHTVAPVVSQDTATAHVNHGHNVAPAVSYGY